VKAAKLGSPERQFLRHMRELLDAGESAFTELKNLVVWNKGNRGMGAFYCSKHEFVFVLKKGSAAAYQQFWA
jgi:hypothetical protein